MQQYFFFYLFHVLQLWSLLLSTHTNQPLSEEHDATKLFTNAVAQIWKSYFAFHYYQNTFVLSCNWKSVLVFL